MFVSLRRRRRTRPIVESHKLNYHIASYSRLSCMCMSLLSCWQNNFRISQILKIVKFLEILYNIKLSRYYQNVIKYLQLECSIKHLNIHLFCQFSNLFRHIWNSRTQNKKKLVKLVLLAASQFPLRRFYSIIYYINIPGPGFNRRSLMSLTRLSWNPYDSPPLRFELRYRH